MGTEAVLDFRLNIDVEYQGWILIFASMTALWCLCLPCYCAGLSISGARRFAAWVQQRLPAFYVFIVLFDMLFLYLIVTWLPDWTLAQYLAVVAHLMGFMAKHLLNFMVSIALITVFVFVVLFKDRIALLAGIDHKRMFRCRFRDIFTCGSNAQLRPIEFTIWKVEDLKSASLMGANNIFVEVFLGFNEPMRTRVHNNAGSETILKETMQFNFDEFDEDESMFIFVRNQKVMGASELGRLELNPAAITELIKKAKETHAAGVKYDSNCFISQRLMPRGTIWIRVADVDDEELLPRGGASDLMTC
eukprot:gnl/TRDRNA2_/TRDRNA2_182774_c0_seq1.p1 gnl/TRDRNA2_/TRDRNA2_182774_c0~~gnl/TRDRNA2_/TRDRNA2_182774_c0_seq1.p1  ORF type:complete len:320 (+),score=51.59 gnl/TRDRNA2_/TRDRNA2_182774_c0_seq1:51-962(+)